MWTHLIGGGGWVACIESGVLNEGGDDRYVAQQRRHDKLAGGQNNEKMNETDKRSGNKLDDGQGAENRHGMYTYDGAKSTNGRMAGQILPRDESSLVKLRMHQSNAASIFHPHKNIHIKYVIRLQA